MNFRKILLVIVLLFMVVPVYAVDTDELFLENIFINGEVIEGFQKDKYEYEIKLDKAVESVLIGYTPNANEENSKFFVSTEGEAISSDYKLKPGENVVKIKLRSKEDYKIEKTYTLKLIKEDTRSSDATLSSLTVGGVEVPLKDDTFEYTVLVNNKLKSVEVAATIRDNKASFIQGYGERLGNNAVALSGETTNIEVRVKAENETTKIYKITIKKDDYKNNDASLKSLTIKELKFNFSKDVITYNLEVNNEIDKINIEAVTNDAKAKVNYNKEVTLQEGLNKVTIVVTAEDGSERSYRLNITRKEKVSLVEKIEIEGVDFEFDPETLEYDIKTTSTILNFTVSLNDKEATYEILDNEDLKNGSTVSLVIKNKDSELTYKFNIINDEEEPEIDNTIDNIDDSIDEENNNIPKENFLKKNEMLIGLLTLGVGILSMLFAVLTKFKNSKIM